VFDFLAIAWAAGPTQPASAQHASAAVPPPDLIEFLGEWGDDNGNVVDPSSLVSPSAGPEGTSGNSAGTPAVTGGSVRAPSPR